MADQNAPQGRRPHYHRGRRGQDRRGGERRAPQHPQETHASRDHVDVDQIMREIRARISQQHGIELSNQQIQELAARRLDAILEPRHVAPALLEQLRRAAREPVELPPPTANGGYTFDETTLYNSGTGFIRTLRSVLRPILKLFFDPKPIADVLHTQARLNADAAARAAARDATQAEWNALHYEILQRLVTEVSRVSLEMQALSLRVESLGAKVDFNERRVRGVEQMFHQARPGAVRPLESAPQAAAAAATPPGTDGTPSDGASDARRRRRRRRRGRRGGAGGPEGVSQTSAPMAGAQEPEDFDEGEEADTPALAETAAGDVEASNEGRPLPPPSSSDPHERAAAHAPDPAAPPAAPESPTLPAPPRDEPAPPAPVDRADEGPQDR